MNQQVNDNLVLVCGESATGKSASLMNLRDPKGVVYLNTESGKKLPFPAKFQQFVVTDPHQVLEAFDAIEAGKLGAVHTVIIDSLTFWFDQYETQYIVSAADGQKAWMNFQQIFKTLMQEKIARADCNVIVIAHTLTTLNEDKGLYETKIPVKGALKNNGIEAYFSQVIASKKVPLKKLEEYKNPMLVITPDDEALGFKYVFQTRLTKDSTQERLRGPMGLFKQNETFVDNDIQKILDHIHSYYNAS